MPTPLAITRIVIRPNLSAVVEFTAASVAPTRYTVSAQQGADAPITVHTTGTLAVFDAPSIGNAPLKAGKTYSFTVMAEYPDSDDNLTGDASTASTAIIVSFEDVLRQQLADILVAANITIQSDRALRVLQDGYGQPSLFMEKDAQDRFPAVEIGVPFLKTSTGASNVRRVDVLECEFRIADTAQDENGAYSRLNLLSTLIRRTLNAKTGLGLTWLGVINQSWDWVGGEPETMAQFAIMPLKLMVPLPAQMVGKLPFEA